MEHGMRGLLPSSRGKPFLECVSVELQDDETVPDQPTGIQGKILPLTLQIDPDYADGGIRLNPSGLGLDDFRF
jgi:hypothetical protein